MEEIDDFDPSGPEPSQPSADWYAQRDAHFHDDVYDDECVNDDDAVIKKRKLYYFSSASSILLMVFFFLQLIYMITCSLYHFETIKFDLSTFSTFCPMLVQIFYFLSTKNFVLQQSFDYALMMEEDYSSSSSKRSYSPSKSESRSFKRSFFGSPCFKS